MAEPRALSSRQKPVNDFPRDERREDLSPARLIKKPGQSDDRIKQIILNDPPASHWQRPALLNVLRVTDIPEVAGAFAPHRLVSLTKLPATFDFTQRIYRRERASNQFTQSGSLPEALEVWNQQPLFQSGNEASPKTR